MLSRKTVPCRAPSAAIPAVRTIRNLLSQEQFSHAVHRESARVDRGEGDLTLVLFKLPNPRRKYALSTVRLIRLLIQRVRVTDDLGWFDRQHVGLLLPNTNVTGAWALAQSVCDALEKPGQPRLQCQLYSYPSDASQIAPSSIELTPPPIRVAS